MTFEIQNLSVRDLADRFGTPLYLYDGDVLAGQYQGLRARLHGDVEIFYSMKANPNVAVCQLLHRLGARAEVSSMVELVTAQRAGVPADEIMFLGPGKSEEELAACARGEAGLFVAESFGELDRYDAMVAEAGGHGRTLIRVNPAFSVKGAGLTMGGKARQFGIDEDQLMRSGPAAERWPHLRIAGVQAYMGTRILQEAAVVADTTQIMAMAERITAALGCALDVVDVGGGLGIAYFEGERDLDVDVLAAGLNPVVDDFRRRHPHTRVLMELGRYLTAPAGTYVVRVRYVKDSHGEPFAVADGGTNHHMAAVGIGSFVKRNFPVALLSRDAADDNRPWNISGPLCTPNDLLVKRAVLPALRPGDLLGIGRSGAYGPSASPGLFLSHGFPAEVLVLDGVAHLVRRRDAVADLIQTQFVIDLEGRTGDSGERRHQGAGAGAGAGAAGR
ncbi:type III PLP-dependent enzyme [Actinoplanes sp. TBRC 11911]|uniref:type III PLP-dependent enzyme n=1 Tax=Actinoplanes sp. TBRC 11911 TaxID=2729386 RepID=UPI00145DA9D1|nr:type III PLP-dependent enzyme [Actinoplanes sp. TBRC 11911]NMO53359.1 type III PLP-dependent enzyme [Actinoplanes sp. TBRC 11911]